jgi:hypothetical protein
MFYALIEAAFFVVPVLPGPDFKVIDHADQNDFLDEPGIFPQRGWNQYAVLSVAIAVGGVADEKPSEES